MADTAAVRMMRRKQARSGFTLIEMIITLSLVAVLALSALPLGKMAVKRGNEIELQRALRLMREAIDAYKKLADEKKIEVDSDSDGYPPDLAAGVAVRECRRALAEWPQFERVLLVAFDEAMRVRYERLLREVA